MATLLERAQITTDPDFCRRLESAQMVVTAEVLQEDAGTPDHDVRAKLAAYVLREPEVVARRLAYVMRAIPSLAADVTDDALLTLVRQRWTVFAAVAA
jgi:hypothetical protein